MHSMNDAPCSACGDLDGCHLPAKIRNKRLTMPEFHAAQADWSQKTFGADAERGPFGPLKHLAREVLTEMLGIPRETVTTLLAQAKTGDGMTDAMEYADLQFLVFDSARRAGFTYADLLKACNEKLVVNMARKWGPKTGDEPVEHVREDDDDEEADTWVYTETGTTDQE